MIGKTKKEYDLIDNFGELDFGMDNDDRKEMDNICPIHLTEWNIVNAFNVINDNAPRSRLNKELFVGVDCANTIVCMNVQTARTA